MKQQFILFRRSGVYYLEDRKTRKQKSLGTKSKAEPILKLNAENEKVRQPNLNLQLARAYLSARRARRRATPRPCRPKTWTGKRKPFFPPDENGDAGPSGHRQKLARAPGTTPLLRAVFPEKFAFA